MLPRQSNTALSALPGGDAFSSWCLYYRRPDVAKELLVAAGECLISKVRPSNKTRYICRHGPSWPPRHHVAVGTIATSRQATAFLPAIIASDTLPFFLLLPL